jgi:hypothetical protein
LILKDVAPRSEVGDIETANGELAEGWVTWDEALHEPNIDKPSVRERATCLVE